MRLKRKRSSLLNYHNLYGNEPFCHVISIEDVKNGIQLPCIIKILDRDYYKVTFLYNTLEVKSFDFSKWFEDFKGIEMYKPFYKEKKFATMYYDRKAMLVVIPAIVTGKCSYTGIYDEQYLKKKGYKPYDGIHFGDYFMFSGDSIYEESHYICSYDEWSYKKYGKRKITKRKSYKKR